MILAHWNRLKEEQKFVEAGIEHVKSESQIVGSETLNKTLTGIQSGDLVLVSLVSDVTNVGQTISGWTLIADEGGIHDAAFYYAFATGTSINITSNDNRLVCTFSAYRGVNSTTPLDVTPPALVGGSSETSVTPASITTVTNGCMIVVQLGIDDDDATGISGPTGYTKGASGYNSGYPATGLVFYKSQASAGTESPSTITFDSSEHHYALTLALRPA